MGGSVAFPSRRVHLYSSTACPYSEAAREELEWRGVDFVEFDVEKDAQARERMLEITGGNRTVPVVVGEDGSVQVGWQGRGCVV